MRLHHVAALFTLVLLSFSGAAADIRVRMMTQASDGQTLVFEPMFIKAKVGDTITFEPMQKAGHTSISVFEPVGATPWKAQPDSKITVKMEKQGIYLVECNMHKMMGMVAVVQVGKPVNLEEAKKRAEEESAKMMTHKERFAQLLSMVK